jgi:hypothetical protein
MTSVVVPYQSRMLVWESFLPHIPGQLIMQMGGRLWASVEGAPMMEQQLLSSSQPPVARPTIGDP